MRIVTSRHASVVLNNLFKLTPMQTSFPVNNIALVDGRPMLLTLRDLIRHFVEHRHDVVVRRTRYDLPAPRRSASALERDCLMRSIISTR